MMESMEFEIIKLILTTITVLFAGIQLLLLVLEIKSNKKWNQQNAALKYCIRYSEVIKDKENFELRDMCKKDVIDFFNINSKKGRSRRRQVTYILQYFERLSIGVLCDYYDEEIVRRTLDFILVNTYKQLEPYISLRRDETNKEVFSHFERVAKVWSKKSMRYPYRTTPSNRKKWKRK